ncbi:hypothetical protein D3OALGA1CA_3304 [Olavius algarvensis associated proteobacterium Delta 3]|nr:hypothetical protein D3OALGB2SA_1206 [Olavius algarvensis associated proteobacterium Delta 3]CAB5132262.1 hypothetical protein D3OALGA1CA_3304 [Olavius algarvensis associated proteobacterium Delta 3]
MRHGAKDGSIKPVRATARQDLTLFILLRNLSPPNALDESVYLNCENTKYTAVDVARAAIQMVIRQHPDFCFIYSEGLDLAGHADGWMSEAYDRFADPGPRRKWPG